MKSENKIIITPKTKIYDLIVAYPQLEQKLKEIVPTFSNLKNNDVRNAIARVSSLQQIAAISSLKIDELIHLLREEVGQDCLLENETSGLSLNHSSPAWFNQNKIIAHLDVRPILASGDHPVHQVMAELSTLQNDKIFKMTAPFLPVPLIEKAASINCRHWVEKISETEYNIYFTK